MSAADDDVEEHTWPANLLDAAEVRRWIGSALPDALVVTGPLEVYRAKEWGVTARFEALSPGGEPHVVVFKATVLPLFASAPWTYALLTRTCPGRVPELLAWARHEQGAWMLFAAYEGRPVAETADLAPLLAVARTLAEVQVAIAALPPAEAAPLPRVPAERLPEMFEAVLADIASRQQAFWRGEGRELARQFALPVHPAAQMESFRPQVRAWATELAVGGWPLTLDHVDLQPENAVIQPDGLLLLLDWEEANISLPFFSLDRLLDDAHERAGVAGVRALRAAYVEALPWGTRAELERALTVALCLAPIKHAYECLRLAEALGWDEGCPHVSAWALGRALPRWKRLAVAEPRRG
jgi:hypothetical protein